MDSDELGQSRKFSLIALIEAIGEQSIDLKNIYIYEYFRYFMVLGTVSYSTDLFYLIVKVNEIVLK